MRAEFRSLRIKQLDRALKPFLAAKAVSRPEHGWLRAIREALGISASDLARTMGTSRSLPLLLEKSEAENTITLNRLKAVANALDCELVYALVPRAGSIEQLANNRFRCDARKHIADVEHSMALENQAVGHTEEAAPIETDRLARSAGAGR
jgi:predicted DNA-binding mobile mystery protein A